MTLAFPKPQKPERGTKATERWCALVRQLPCICCSSPCEHLHHAIMGRGAQRRASDWDVLPMCFRHHNELHNERAEWEGTYGKDTDYLPAVKLAVEQLTRRTIGGR